MRLVTWNCSKGPYDRKVARLLDLHADIALMQECPRPSVESETCLWFGDNPRQGILIRSQLPFRIHPLPTLANVPKFVVPISVTGPIDFTLFAVWSKARQQYKYIRGVVRAVEMYQTMFIDNASVLMGDLNSSVIWDKDHPPAQNQSALVAKLKEWGLSSAYHEYLGEAQGIETKPTHYFHWDEKRAFHIDYCFVPVAWVPHISAVHVGGFDEWRNVSDHRPMTVDIEIDKIRGVDTPPGLVGS